MSLARLLKQSITIENPGGTRGRHGEATMGASATAAARFQRTRKTILMPTGERQPIDGLVFIGPDTTVQMGAKVTYLSQAYRVMRIDDVPGRRGDIHHRELSVQQWSFPT